jgi:hypothetical protein
MYNWVGRKTEEIIASAAPGSLPGPRFQGLLFKEKLGIWIFLLKC